MLVVVDGSLTCDSQEMRRFFEDCVNGVIELLDSQIDKLKKATNRKPRVSFVAFQPSCLLTHIQNVFLVGGFGASPYLQFHLEESLGLGRGAVLRRPDPDKS